MKNILLKGLFVSASFIFLTSSASATTCTNLTKALSKGSENSEVLKLQQFLFDGGYLTAKPNGYFGNGTVMAVKKFQQANGLSQVGSVGPGTRGKIKDASCSGVSSNGNVTKSSAVKASKRADIPVVSLADLKKTWEANFKSTGVNVPLSIVDSQSSGGSYAEYFDFSKVKTEDYFIQAYKMKGDTGYVNDLYVLTVGLGNRFETGKASVIFTDVGCDPGMEVKNAFGKDICKKGNTSFGDFNINGGSGAGKVNLAIKGKGKVRGDLFVSFATDGITAGSVTGNKPYIVLSKNITFDTQQIQEVVTVVKTDKELADDRNTRRLRDTIMIYGSLVQYAEDNGGNLPVSIPSSAKEICMTGAPYCERSLVDLSALIPIYTNKIPVEVGKELANGGAGYRISKIGDIITVSAQFSENGKTIQTSCNYKKAGCTQ